jgi:hypothetical protein
MLSALPNTSNSSGPAMLPATAAPMRIADNASRMAAALTLSFAV